MIEPEYSIGNIVITDNAGNYKQWEVVGAFLNSGDSEWQYNIKTLEGDNKTVYSRDIVAYKVDNRPWEPEEAFKVESSSPDLDISL